MSAGLATNLAINPISDDPRAAIANSFPPKDEIPPIDADTFSAALRVLLHPKLQMGRAPLLQFIKDTNERIYCRAVNLGCSAPSTECPDTGRTASEVVSGFVDRVVAWSKAVTAILHHHNLVSEAPRNDAKVVLTLLTYSRRYGQHVAETLQAAERIFNSGDYSPSFKDAEGQRAALTALSILEDTRVTAAAAGARRYWDRGLRTDAHDALVRLSSLVIRHTFDQCGVSPEFRPPDSELDLFVPYKYAQILGLVDDLKWNNLVRREGDRYVITRIDPDVALLGSFGAARVLLENQAIRALLYPAKPADKAVRSYVDAHADDYWQISGRVSAARTFYRELGVPMSIHIDGLGPLRPLDRPCYLKPVKHFAEWAKNVFSIVKRNEPIESH